MLYTEKNVTEAPGTITPPASDIKTLNDLTTTGVSQIHNREHNYSVEGEKRGRTFRRRTSNKSLPINATGFFVPYTNLTPQEAILKHGFRFVREDIHPVFGKVLVFRGEYPDPQLAYPITFHLAPEFGYRVVYSTITIAKARQQTVHAVKSLINVQGYWLPGESEKRQLSKDPSIMEPEIITTHKFTNHSVNDVTEDMLEIEPTPGDYEWHEKDNSSYKVGANGERIFLDVNEANSPKKLWPGWLFTASVTFLLVLTIVAYVRWKRQQLSKSA